MKYGLQLNKTKTTVVIIECVANKPTYHTVVAVCSITYKRTMVDVSMPMERRATITLIKIRKETDIAKITKLRLTSVLILQVVTYEAETLAVRGKLMKETAHYVVRVSKTRPAHRTNESALHTVGSDTELRRH